MLFKPIWFTYFLQYNHLVDLMWQNKKGGLWVDGTLILTVIVMTLTENLPFVTNDTHGISIRA